MQTHAAGVTLGTELGLVAGITASGQADCTHGVRHAVIQGKYFFRWDRHGSGLYFMPQVVFMAERNAFKLLYNHGPKMFHGIKNWRIGGPLPPIELPNGIGG